MINKKQNLNKINILIYLVNNIDIFRSFTIPQEPSNSDKIDYPQNTRVMDTLYFKTK